jgi:hypothetical protein
MFLLILKEKADQSLNFTLYMKDHCVFGVVFFYCHKFDNVDLNVHFDFQLILFLDSIKLYGGRDNVSKTSVRIVGIKDYETFIFANEVIFKRC